MHSYLCTKSNIFHTQCQDNSSDWLSTYNNSVFRQSIFFKGPLLAKTETNVNITFSLAYFLPTFILLEQQSTKNDDDNSWPTFLLNNILGLRKSQRLKTHSTQHNTWYYKRLSPTTQLNHIISLIFTVSYKIRLEPKAYL